MLDGVSPEADTGVGDTSGGFVDWPGGGGGVVTMSEQSIPPKPSRQTQVFTFEQTWLYRRSLSFEVFYSSFFLDLGVQEALKAWLLCYRIDPVA